MTLDKEKLLKRLMANPHIANRVKELALNAEEIDEALPIMIDMDLESKANDFKHYQTTFYRTKSGSIQRQDIISHHGQKELYWQKIMTQHLYHLEFDETLEYHKTPSRQVVLSQIAQYVQNPHLPTQGIYLYGPMGVGKTFTLKLIAKQLAQKGHTIGFVNVPELVMKIKATFNNKNFYYEIEALLKQVDVLLIDGIGAETISPWFRDEFLYIILNYRAQNQKLTFFSSNYDFKELAQIEARTSGQNWKDIDKANRLVNRIQLLAMQMKMAKLI